MADSKISELSALTSPANDDEFVVVDTDAGVTKRITFSNLNSSVSAVATSIAADNITTGDAAVTIATSSGNITIDTQAGDADIIFKGTDNTSDITALTLDMSEAGAAAFNSTVTATGFIIGSASIDETELEILDGATLSTTELNYVDGVTGAIQDQLDAKQATLTFGIANTNVPKFTSGVVDDDFLRIAGTTVEGRSASEVLSDIGGQASLTFGISNTNAVKIDSSSVADDEYARFTANGLESRSTSEVLSDIGGITASSSDTLTNKSIDSDNNTITNIVNADIKSSAAIVFSKMENLTASRALVSDGSGDVSAATTTSTEIGYVNGVTSAIQTQLNTKSHINYNLTKTANYTAVAGDKILCDTSGGAFTITLPASPSAGDEVHVLDATASFDSNNLTVGRNSKKIQGATDDLTITTQNTGIGLVFYNDTYGWRVLVDAYDVDVPEL